MTDDSKKHLEEPDPLSATAMFFRALDQHSGSTQPEPSATNSGPAVPEPNVTRPEPSPFESHTTGRKGEFTEVFGNPISAQSTFSPAVPVRSASPDLQSPTQAVRLGAESAGKQPPGEFTRIFVRDVPPSAKPDARAVENRSEALPSPAAGTRGFSSPGSSGAASADTGFTQMFKASAKPTAGNSGPPVQPLVSPFRHETPLGNLSANPTPGEKPLSRPTDTPKSVQHDQSITSFIESLSSPAPSSSVPRAPEPTPYRPDPLASYQPVAKPAASPDFESGGVTRFIQRLSDPPSVPPAAPSPPPVREVQSGEGEFTRIISAPFKAPLSTAPTPAAPPATAAAPMPAMPAPSAVPAAHLPAAPAFAAPASPAAHLPPAPAMPSPHLPPAPALPTISAPKGKLEALVPMLLVVNTFLLVIILVVMIFLIKAR